MKRISNIYEDIYNFSNLYDAYLKARKGKRYRREVLEYTRNLEENLIGLQNELIWGMYRQGEYREFKVFIPKVRTIKALPFRDRVLQHAVNTIIEPIFEKQFYTHSYACRKGKGLHDASKQLKTWQFLAKKNGQKLYCLKCDIKKYFDSVDLRILYSIIKRKIKDKKFLWLVRQILEVKEKQKGLPIGNLTSQLFANVYLNELDKFVKEELKAKKYIRYMDDFLLFSESKEELHNFLKRIIEFLNNKLKLELNHKTRIFPVETGVDFVGYIHYAEYLKVRKSTWKRQKKTLKNISRGFKEGKITVERLRSTYASVAGHISHADTYKLKSKLLNHYNNLLVENKMKELERCENE